MRYNKIDRSRFSKARRHLIELTKAYGLKHIEVVKNGETTPQKVLVRTYVLMECKKLGIRFDEEMSRLDNWKARNKNLTLKQMTVLVLRAFIDLKKGYIEDFTPENDLDREKIDTINKSMRKDNKYLMTFSEYDVESLIAFPLNELYEGTVTDERWEEINNCRKWLKSMHFNLGTINGINGAFWTFSLANISITQNLRDAMVSYTDSLEVRDYIDYCCDKYNMIQSDIEGLMNNKKDTSLKKTFLAEKLKEELNKIKAESEAKTLKNKEYKEIIKEKNQEIIKLQKRCSEENITKLEKKISKREKRITKLEIKIKKYGGYKGVVKYLWTGLISPNSKFGNVYDLNKEEDMHLYLRWFEYSLKQLQENTVEQIVQHRIVDEAAAERFRQLVGEMNARIKFAAELGKADDSELEE